MPKKAQEKLRIKMNKIIKALGNVLGNLCETDENVLNKRGQRTTLKETMRIEKNFSEEIREVREHIARMMEATTNFKLLNSTAFREGSRERGYS